MDQCRYYFEFDFLPRIIADSGNHFVVDTVMGGEEFLASLFNEFCRRMMKQENPSYSEEDFKIHHKVISDTRCVMYIEFPEPGPENKIYCTAVAVTYVDESPMVIDPEYIRDVKYFTVEASFMGTSCIGGKDGDNHINYGDPGETMEQTIDIIAGLAFNQ